ncbi:hypothetical protein ACTND8_08940 [Atopobiaceae bacterium HCP3S3_F7]|uniref:hypothetical protein n=1 Tax=Bacillati TaxID=1783272 RepID=UPI003F8CEED8
MVSISTTITGWTVRFRVDVDADKVGLPITVMATAADVERPVRGWSRPRPAPASLVAIDHEASLSHPTRYDVVISGRIAASATVTVPSALPVITDPIRGRHIPVTIGSWDEWAHDRNQISLTVARRRDPIILDAVEMLPTSTITLIHTAGGAAALADLLQDQSLVQIRPTCPYLPTAWVSCGARKRSLFSHAPGSATVDQISVQHIGQPAPDTTAQGNTLRDLALAVPTTLAAIAARWPQMIDIAYEDLAS